MLLKSLQLKTRWSTVTKDDKDTCVTAGFQKSSKLILVLTPKSQKKFVIDKKIV